MFKTTAAVFALVLLSGASVWAADPPDAPAPPSTADAPAAISVTASGDASDVNADSVAKMDKLLYQAAAAAAQYKQVTAQAEAVAKELQDVQLMDATAEAQFGPNTQRVQNLREQMKQLEEQLEQLKSKGSVFQAVRINVTFLGVGAEPVSEAMGEQLQLQPGFGLMVQSITPNSPAEAAGIKRYDVLTKLDDQLLIAPAQLEALVRSHKNGDHVTLTLIHGGQTGTVTAKLGTNVAGGPVSVPAAPKVHFFLNQENPASKGAGGPFASPSASYSIASIALNDGQYSLTLDGKNNLKAVEVASGKVLFDGPLGTSDQFQALPQEIHPLLHQMLQKKQAMILQPPAPGSVTFSTTQPAQVIAADSVLLSPSGSGPLTWVGQQSNVRNLVWANGTHALILTMTDDKPTHLLVMGANGKTLFDGPVETTEQQAAIPAEVRDGFDFLVQHPDAGHEIGK